MKIIDLTHTISEDMPVYPGTEPPELAPSCTLEKDGFVEKRISLYSHTGTHIDTPAHLFTYGKTLDQFTVSAFFGMATVLDVSGLASSKITKGVLVPAESLLEKADFALLHTGWSSYWEQKEYLYGYPALSVEAAQWLAGFSLKGVGVDTISVDDLRAAELPVHQVFLKQDILLIENLTNLAPLAGRLFHFSCFPLKLRDGDGSPVRAVAILNE